MNSGTATIHVNSKAAGNASRDGSGGTCGVVVPGVVEVHGREVVVDVVVPLVGVVVLIVGVVVLFAGVVVDAPAGTLSRA